jgi:amino-acid N-acetyltransferase
MEYNGIIVRQATLADVERMHALINHFADKGLMLPKARSKLYQNIRDFFVAEQVDDGGLPTFVGCGALHVLWEDLGEIRSLAVDERFQGSGVGCHLVHVLLQDATRLRLPQLFVLTYQQAFFERMGFLLVNKETLPRKVWGECFDCPKFPNCEEIAMTLDAPFDAYAEPVGRAGARRSQAEPVAGAESVIGAN